MICACFRPILLHQRLNAIFAAAIAAVTFIVYVWIVAPTVSFWDCGEYIAVGPTLAKTTQYGLDYRFPNLKPWFEYIQPVERVGSLLLYYVPPGTLRQAQ